MEFEKKRRQQFLNKSAYETTLNFYENIACPGYLEEIASPSANASDRWRNAYSYADTRFMSFMLKYTAGEAIGELRDQLEETISAHEIAAKYVQQYAQDPAFPPLRFIEIDEYERVLQLIGFCFLLRREDLLIRVAAIFDPSSRNVDTVYEDLLAFGMDDRYDLDQWYHDAPYTDLVKCLYRDSDAESIVDMKQYLKNWYISLAKAPWHDSHLGMTAEFCGGYFGYWAIEAAAVSYLMELDDSSYRDHLLYPKDLVDFAKNMDININTTNAEYKNDTMLRVVGGEACPQTGYWTTPATEDSRTYFRKNDRMPVFKASDYGDTIWQWSDSQSDRTD